MKSYQKVVVGGLKQDAWGASHLVNYGGALHFQTHSEARVNTLDLTFKANYIGQQQVSTEGYHTLNIHLPTGGKPSFEKFFWLDLSLVNVDDGYPSASDARDFATQGQVPDNHWTRATLSKIIVQGGVGVVNGVVEDRLSLGEISAVVDVLDISGYRGTVSAKLEQELSSTIAGVKHSTGNTLVKVGGFGFTVIDSLRLSDNHGVTTFQFTQDAVQSAAKTGSEFAWTIHMFEGIHDYFARPDSISVLDLRALHVHGLNELKMTQAGDDAILKGTAGQNFKIVLTGTSLDDLGVENFIFA